MNDYTNRVWLRGRIDNLSYSKFDNQLPLAEFQLQTKSTFYDTTGLKKIQLLKHKCKIWGKQAEMLERFTKDGTELAVEGLLVNDSSKTRIPETYVQVNDLLILSNNHL
jgi:single-stranded DNA-binding protein